MSALAGRGGWLGRAFAFAMLSIFVFDGPIGAESLFVEISREDLDPIDDIEPFAIGRLGPSALDAELLVPDGTLVLPRLELESAQVRADGFRVRGIQVGDRDIGFSILDAAGELAYGRLELAGRSYRFRPLEDGRHVFFEIEAKDFGDDFVSGPTHPGALLDSCTTSLPPGLGCRDLAPTAVLDVLFVITGKAAGKMNVAAEVREQVEEANRVLGLSCVRARIGRAVSETVANWQDDHGDLQHHLADAMVKLELMRKQKKADLVFLVVESGDGGLAQQVLADEAGAYAVLNRRSMEKSWVFVHELGHLLGAGHEKPPPPLAAPYARAFVLTGEFYTVMGDGSECGNCKQHSCCQLGRFSSRLAMHPKGAELLALGDATHDNACVMSHHAKKVAGYFDPP